MSKRPRRTDTSRSGSGTPDPQRPASSSGPPPHRQNIAGSSPSDIWPPGFGHPPGLPNRMDHAMYQTQPTVPPHQQQFFLPPQSQMNQPQSAVAPQQQQYLSPPQSQSHGPPGGQGMSYSNMPSTSSSSTAPLPSAPMIHSVVSADPRPGDPGWKTYRQRQRRANIPEAEKTRFNEKRRRERKDASDKRRDEIRLQHEEEKAARLEELRAWEQQKGAEIEDARRQQVEAKNDKDHNRFWKL